MDRSNRVGRVATYILVLVAVLLCVALIGPRTGPGLSNAKPRTAEQQARMLRSALDTMRLDIGRYPTAEEGLALLVTPPRDEATAKNWRGPYIEGRVPLDPWSQPYHYGPLGKPPSPIAVYSDGQPGYGGGPFGFPPPD